MKKYFPLISSLFFLILAVFLWDQIKLPYNSGNEISGEYNVKKFNPLNEIVRFLSFILIPSAVYLFSYLYVNNKETYNFSIKSQNYFLKKKGSSYSSLNFYFFLFVIIISLEFFSLNFTSFVSESDLFHDGTFLVPPMNYLNNVGVFRATAHDYGLIANNLGLISQYFLGYYSLGSISFIKLILIYLTKLSLILILKKIISNLDLNDLFKKIFFIIITFITISLPNYYDFNSYFSYRHSLYLLFIFILGSTLINTRILNYKFIFVGSFSLISFLWWFDIGTYVNALIFCSIIFLLIHKELKNTFLLILGIVLPWTLFFLILPVEETREFIAQLKFAFSSATQDIVGLEYRKPFSAESGRWTKALMLIYVTSIMIINFNFSKKFYIGHKTKIFINLIFVSGIFVFNSALMRSDSNHLKYSAGLYTLAFILILVLFLFQRLERNKKIQTFVESTQMELIPRSIFLFYTVLAILFILGIFNKYDKILLSEKAQNISNFKKNITFLIKAKDDLYLSKNNKLIIDYYKKISKDDRCVQALTDEIAFPYFLKKPTCTQFYIPAQIIDGFAAKKFINQLRSASPNIILFKSPFIILKNNSNMSEATEYIKKEYSFFKNYNNYIFYKKN